MTDKKNQYYMPEFFELIRKKLYLMPLWSGVLIKQCQKLLVEHNLVSLGAKILCATRFDNNIVENHIGHYKYDLFQERKYMVISEIAGPIYRRLKLKYLELYIDKNNGDSDDKKVYLSDIFECWSDKKYKSKRSKSYYYKSYLENECSKEDVGDFNLING